MRGKYQKRAETRRSEKETEDLIAGYQKRIKELTADNANLKTKVKAELERGRSQVARLSAELHAGVSPELRAARKVNDKLRDDLGKMRNKFEKTDRSLNQAFRSMSHLLVNNFGLTNVEANEMLMACMCEGFDSKTVLKAEGGLFEVNSPQEAQMLLVLQRARGERH